MRIFLLPISTRRTLIYCEKLASAPSSTSASPASVSPLPLSTLPDRVVARANTTWADWERSDSGWKKTITTYGNRAFARIPFEEWGLKSLPALHASTQESATKTAVIFPAKFLPESRVVEILKRIATEREKLHKRRLVGSVVAMPFTIPVGLIPVLPNVPFIYLAFRAWSHYKAWFGGKYLAYLLARGLVSPTGSRILDEHYARGLMDQRAAAAIPGKVNSKTKPRIQAAEVDKLAKMIETKEAEDQEVLLLKGWTGQMIAEEFKLPEMEVEIERAVEQVEKAIEEARGAGKA
ncbi:hypothetical protein CAC42_4078 [Sphaceloma murrayae]|uniref:Mitochondrial K+-H+ exchange-related-domain-containing protein n=1 Tax=Sphaceloma murrayae TaxID=2082308 RepID=A0A2K1QKD9_9PEZI|nr:hypothetical protein CAC42_4078 [Sphaceloma murrayae]